VGEKRKSEKMRCILHNGRKNGQPNSQKKGGITVILDRIALILAIIGGLNWGLIGLFRFDLVAWLFGGSASMLSRIVYTLVGLAAIWCISLLFRERSAGDNSQSQN
jgi:hypothetical protein